MVGLAAVDAHGLEHIEDLAQAQPSHCQTIVVHIAKGLGAQHHQHCQQDLGQHPAQTLGGREVHMSTGDEQSTLHPIHALAAVAQLQGGKQSGQTLGRRQGSQNVF